MQPTHLQMRQLSKQPVSNQLNAVGLLADKIHKRQNTIITGENMRTHTDMNVKGRMTRAYQNVSAFSGGQA